MEATDKVFIDNNLCEINDRIIRKLITLSEVLEKEVNGEYTQTINEITKDVFFAKKKGIKIENRLKHYLYTIRALGFKRDRELEGEQEIVIINNRITIRCRAGSPEHAENNGLTPFANAQG